MTSDGQPYGPQRFAEIIKERYFISKQTHTSYLDVGLITPTERKYLLDFIIKDIETENKKLEKISNKK